MRPGRFGITVLIVLVFAPRAMGQAAGTTAGVLVGKVVDRTGGILSGVVVTAESDALMGSREATSVSDGSYRFPALPPGAYRISFTRPGFETTRRDVRVDPGVTTTVSVRMDPATREEVVVVEASSGAVDRRATGIATVFDAAELAELPGARSMGSILAATPAVLLTRFDVGGSSAFAVGPYSVYGTSGYNRPTVEGISVGGLNPFGFVLDYGTFDHVAVGTGAYGPVWPSPGLHMQILVKSGGNRYAGSAYAGFEHGAWQSRNIDDDQARRGAPGVAGVPVDEANRLQRYQDLNADAGGYVRRDRVWWYASGRRQASAARQVIFAAEPLETTVTTLTGKGTWRPKDGHQVVAFAQGGHNRQPIRIDGFLRTSTALNPSVDSTSDQLAQGLVWKAEWSAVVGPRLVVEARAGQFTASRAERPNGFAPRTEDLQTPNVSGGNRDWMQEMTTDQVEAAATYFKDGRGGSHQITAGVQLQRTMASERWLRAYPGDVLHVTENGTARQVFLFQAPSESRSGQWWYAAYVGDRWLPHDRLTLNIGLRFDRFRSFLPEQEHPAGRFNPTRQEFAAVDHVASWNALAPRLGASYDPGGDGRTLLKFSYGHHWLPPTEDLGFNANPNGRVWWERFTWSDLNDDGVWQPGEESDRLDRRGGEPTESIDPDLQLAYIREATARLEREVTPGFVVSTGLVWRGERQHGTRQRASWPYEAFSVPLPLPDPGPDATFGTGDDGPDLEVFELRPELLGQGGIIVRNPPHTASNHLTWEVVARRRLGGRWSLLAAFAHGWNQDHASSYVGQPVRANDYPVTPNDFINTDSRGRHVYRDWSLRLLGSWQGPWGIRVTPFVRHQSGQAFGRTLAARLNYATIRVLAEPVGTRRQDHITLVDVGVEKNVRFSGGRRVAVFVEIFNALNANPATNVSWETGASFLRPLAIAPPRIARLGLRIDW